jgi:hypothetical protein
VRLPVYTNKVAIVAAINTSMITWVFFICSSICGAKIVLKWLTANKDVWLPAPGLLRWPHLSFGHLLQRRREVDEFYSIADGLRD